MELWIPLILQGHPTHLENWWKSVGQVVPSLASPTFLQGYENVKWLKHFNV